MSYLLSNTNLGRRWKTFLEFLNRQHPRIRFTLEEASDGQLPFMDVKFERKKDGQLRHEVYRKAMHTDRYLQFSSNDTDNVKAGVIQGLVDRAMILSSDQTAYRQEVAKITSTFRNNSYPRKFVEKAVKRQERCAMRQSKNRLKEKKQERRTVFISYVEGQSEEIQMIAWKAALRCVFYAKRTLRGLYRVKDKLPEEKSRNVVYAVMCNMQRIIYRRNRESARSEEERIL